MSLLAAVGDPAGVPSTAVPAALAAPWPGGLVAAVPSLGPLAAGTAGPGTVAGPVTPATAPPLQGVLGGVFETLQEAVETTRGPFGLAIVFVYSFLIAFLLPLPSEVVLAAPLQLGLPLWARLALITVVSGAGKAAGSVFAFHFGQEAKEYGPLLRALKRSRFDVVEYSERKTVQIAQSYGYLGLAAALCVPGFPDTLSIYAFSVLEDDYLKFAAATFAGSVGRLVVTIVFLGGASVVV